MYVATDSGPVPGDATEPSTDLGALHAFVTAKACPPGGWLVLRDTAKVSVDVKYKVWIYSTVGKTAGECEAAILLALQEYFTTRAIGGDRLPSDPEHGFVFRDDILGVIKSVFAVDAFHTVVDAPSGDVACGWSGVPMLGKVTGAVVLVERT